MELFYLFKRISMNLLYIKFELLRSVVLSEILIRLLLLLCLYILILLWHNFTSQLELVSSCLYCSRKKCVKSSI